MGERHLRHNHDGMGSHALASLYLGVFFNVGVTLANIEMLGAILQRMMESLTTAPK